jgi:protein-tyrosine phosphatase
LSVEDAARAAESLDPPLRVDWLDPLPGEQLGGRGRLGLTILPGKRGASVRYPGRIYRRDLMADLRLLREVGVRRLILLVDDGELERWGDPQIAARGSEAGIEVLRFPIPDGHAPSDPAVMDAILAAVDGPQGEGRDVAVACMGGVGRSGTVAACALVSRGMQPDQAIAAVRAARHPQAVESDEQQGFVHRYAGHRQLASQ